MDERSVSNNNETRSETFEGNIFDAIREKVTQLEAQGSPGVMLIYPEEGDNDIVRIMTNIEGSDAALVLSMLQEALHKATAN